MAFFRNGGDATAAYKEVYKPTCSKKTLYERACRLKNSSKVVARILQLQQQAQTPIIAQVSEVLTYYTKVLRNPQEDTTARLSAGDKLVKYQTKKEALECSLKNQAGEQNQAVTNLPLDFAAFCVKAGYPKPFQKQIEMAEFVRKQGVRLLLGARGYGKTDYGVILTVAYDLIHNPHHTWLIVTKEEQRGKDILREIARIILEQGKNLSKNNSKFLTLAGHSKKDPNVAVLPLRSKSFRGRHPDAIICDDIITPDDVSAAERARVETVLAELLKLTQNVVLIGQPAHAKDVYAKMRGLPGVVKMELPYGTISQLDHDLEAQRAAGISEASIQASYFLQISESERLPFSGVECVNFFPSGGAAGFIDPSHEGEDFTAFAVGVFHFDLFVVCGFAWQKAWNDCIEDIVRIMEALQVKRFAFETNGLGKYPVLLLRNQGANVREWKSTTNKHSRILNAATFKTHIKLAQYLPPKLNTPAFREAQQNFNNMVRDYEYKAPHDDAPDALASLLQFVGVVK